MNIGRAIVKRTMDVAGSALGLLLTSPIIAGTALAIHSTMGYPVVFRQQRPGLNGRPFELIKFRSMRPVKPGEEQVDTDAVRITPLGRFVRATSIDELPTLWNVLKGDMSLVGPRPLLMRYMDRYTPEQTERHNVKPGITGWAQINGRNALTWEEKFKLDTWYVDHQSLWLDLKIVALTVAKVLQRSDISHGGEATMPEFMGTES